MPTHSTPSLRRLVAVALLVLVATWSLVLGCGGSDKRDSSVIDDNRGAIPIPPPPPPRKLILSIGLNTYSESKYANQSAEQDAIAVAHLLRQTSKNGAKSRVLLGQKATRAAIRQSLALLARRAAEPGRDLIVVYFAGHGAAIQLPGDYRSPVGPTKLFMVPFDASAQDWRGTSVGLDELEVVWKSQAEQVIVLLDTSFGSRSRSITEQPIDAVLVKRVLGELDDACRLGGLVQRGILFGADLNQPLTVSPEGESTFAKALCEALAGKADINADSDVTMLELQEFVGPAVRSAAATEYPQTIKFVGDGGVASVVLATGATATTSGDVPDDLEE